MPNYRIKAISNANQSMSGLVLFTYLPTRTDLLKRAKQKLNFKKKYTRLYLPGGEELLTDADITAWLITPPPKRGLEILCSAGEEYVGLRIEAEPEEEPTVATVVELLCSETDGLKFEQDVRDQISNAAHLPGMIQVTALPDLHPGNQFPIGATFVTRDYIHPILIGGDIGCGMAWYRLHLRASRFDNVEGRRKVAGKLNGLEGAWEDGDKRAAWLGDGATGQQEYDKLVGTIGRGNHFAEIQVVDEASGCEETGWTNPVAEGEVLLLVHSGSRGFGKHILEKHTAGLSASLAWCKAGTQEAKVYLEDHDKACSWASLNRDLIAIRFLDLLEPGEEWSINPEEPLEAEITRLKQQLETRKILSIHHNNLTTVSWPPNDPSTTKTAFLHRKGAAPVPGNSLLPLPSSRGTPTLLLHPLPAAMPGTGGRINALSLPHGTGRTMSRGAAAKFATDATVEEALTGYASKKGTGSNQKEETSVVVCDQKNLVWEEAPECYKDVGAVAEEVVRRGLAKVVGKAVPVVCYKVRDEGRN
ncbi:hypothetical protein BJ508DRAFT_414798 [Ascobolus immersus RN42]|uniref:3'-phosphate/5'-hydroxy nucleic acid ligase n=1 Tax=Ascobolus immersus RN42 TaxID=1160509 RepID=A0A3N4I7A2_ASCIM|nr:hypothetical protein BJ508DRAFT_414798 [Ascobolus immersus RN42]